MGGVGQETGFFPTPWSARVSGPPRSRGDAGHEKAPTADRPGRSPSGTVLVSSFQWDRSGLGASRDPTSLPLVSSTRPRSVLLNPRRPSCQTGNCKGGRTDEVSCHQSSRALTHTSQDPPEVYVEYPVVLGLLPWVSHPPTSRDDWFYPSGPSPGRDGGSDIGRRKPERYTRAPSGTSHTGRPT